MLFAQEYQDKIGLGLVLMTITQQPKDNYDFNL
jgi:hypothetical protein